MRLNYFVWKKLLQRLSERLIYVNSWRFNERINVKHNEYISLIKDVLKAPENGGT